MDWPTGLGSIFRTEQFGMYGRAAEVAVTAPYFGAVGKLVGVAPLVTSGTLIQGQVEQEHEESASVSVGVTGSLQWSKETSHSATVQKQFADKTVFHVDKGEWGRVDIRACAGVYTGWIATTNYVNSYDLYPFRAPVHVPDFVSPVAVHQMKTPATAFTPTETALLDEYARVTREARALAAGPGEPDQDTLTKLLPYRADQLRLAGAIKALGI